MSRFATSILLLAFAGALPVFGQTSHESGAASQSVQNSAPLPPSPPDVAIPDPGTFPRHDEDKFPTRRVVDKLMPVCVDWIFHTCWAGAGEGIPSKSDLGFEKNFEVGDTYFRSRNWLGAESRLREALEYKPRHPEATYKLAVCEEKLGKTADARELYESYLELMPSGTYAGKARKALRRIETSAKPKS